MAPHPGDTSALAAFEQAVHRFAPEAPAARQAALDQLAALPMPDGEALVRHHEALLFAAAHPTDTASARAVEARFRHLARHLKSRRGRPDEALTGHGLPWVDTVTRFTHDCVRWLLTHPHCQVAPDGYRQPQLDLSAVLRLTLLGLERGVTSAGLPNEELLAALRVKPAQTLAFLVDQFARFDAQPLLKDQLFDALDLFVRVRPTHAAFSKAGNRLDMGGRVFHQTELLRQFDPLALMNQRLPAPRRLNAAQREEVIRVLKNTMTLTVRETDPATYLDPVALRVYDLERGLSVALFGMTPDRQLPLESYVGFTLFKNGFPVAYGGAWVFGERAEFGMNIFEPYRGGESGYMMCQLLRAYRQSFGLRHIEVDAHQFGLDNPDGIASGAYWFYWRHGFRSLAPELRALAERERERMRAQPSHRSTRRTLLRFTESNVALHFGGPVPPRLDALTARVTTMIARDYAGDRQRAERDCVARFERAAPPAHPLKMAERAVQTEAALLWRAGRRQSTRTAPHLAAMVHAKPRDPWTYQHRLLDWLRASPESRPTGM